MEILLDSTNLRLSPAQPNCLLALIQGVEEFEKQFGMPISKGLREFYTSDGVNPEWIEMLQAAEKSDPWTIGFLVIHREHQQVIGTAGFKGPPDQDGTVEIGYGIVSDFENQGHATDAAGLLTKFASNHPEVKRIRAHTLPEWNASTRVLEKNEFQKVDEIEDPEDGMVWRWERPPVPTKK